ncbi:hypothetical protein STEG23_030910, partial [Scotinomys teguina]
METDSGRWSSGDEHGEANAGHLAFLPTERSCFHVNLQPEQSALVLGSSPSIRPLLAALSALVNGPSLVLYLPPHVLWLPGNFYILSSWRSGVFSSCCLALDSSSSFPCPAFLAIAKSQVTGRSFGDKDFRTGLENGILLCEYVFVPLVEFQKRTEEGFRSSGTGVTDSCEPPWKGEDVNKRAIRERRGNQESVAVETK